MALSSGLLPSCVASPAPARVDQADALLWAAACSFAPPLLPSAFVILTGPQKSVCMASVLHCVGWPSRSWLGCAMGPSSLPAAHAAPAGPGLDSSGEAGSC